MLLFQIDDDESSFFLDDPAIIGFSTLLDKIRIPIYFIYKLVALGSPVNCDWNDLKAYGPIFFLLSP